MPCYKYHAENYTLPELRLLFPQTSLPLEPTSEDLLPLGVTLIPDAAPDATELLARMRAEKLVALSGAHAQAEAFSHFGSSIGIEVDATDTSNRNVAGLITMLEARGETETLFCDYGNQMRAVTIAQLRTLHLEIITYGQMLYARKWELRERINAAGTIEAVQQIEISFDDLPAPTVTMSVTGNRV